MAFISRYGIVRFRKRSVLSFIDSTNWKFLIQLQLWCYSWHCQISNCPWKWGRNPFIDILMKKENRYKKSKIRQCANRFIELRKHSLLSIKMLRRLQKPVGQRYLYRNGRMLAKEWRRVKWRSKKKSRTGRNWSNKQTSN